MSDTPLADKLKAEYYAASEPNERAYLHLFEALATELERKLAEWKDNSSRDIKGLTLQLENSNRQLEEAQKDSDRLDAVINKRLDVQVADDGSFLVYKGFRLVGEGATPRQAIDKAMEDSK